MQRNSINNNKTKNTFFRKKRPSCENIVVSGVLLDTQTARPNILEKKTHYIL